jgi:transporter family-2 protein
MTLQTLLALAAIVTGGIAIAVQAPLNARLGAAVGDPVAAAAVSFGVGFVVLAVLTVARGSVPAPGTLAALPAWLWIGGVLGAIYVVASVWSVAVLGVVTMIAALILGQLVAALVLDATGAFGVPVKEISLTRIGAVVLVGAGLVLSRL